MTEQESAIIFDRLFVAFPSYREWLAKTEKPRETFDAWKKMLRVCHYEDADVAVEKMLSGELEMPAAYERDMLPMRLRSYSLRVTQDRRKYQADRRLAEESQERRRRRGDGDPYEYNLGTLLKESREAGRQLRDGEITREENDAIVAELRRKAQIKKSEVRQ